MDLKYVIYIEFKEINGYFIYFNSSDGSLYTTPSKSSAKFFNDPSECHNIIDKILDAYKRLGIDSSDFDCSLVKA